MSKPKGRCYLAQCDGCNTWFDCEDECFCPSCAKQTAELRAAVKEYRDAVQSIADTKLPYVALPIERKNAAQTRILQLVGAHT